MTLLIITTILWVFSSSPIGGYLTGSVDSYFSVLMRVGLAAPVPLPLPRTCGQSPRTIVFCIPVGAMRLDIMYLLAFHAYLYLTVSEFLLFTAFIPLYIMLIYDLLSGRKLHWGYLLSATPVVLGAAIIRCDKVSDRFWIGLLLVQLSNLCSVIGMVGYKRLMEVCPMPQHNAFVWFYVGAFIVAVAAWFMLDNPQKLPTATLQWSMLVWPNVVASGLGYFMRNYGATQADVGTLGIMNNVHVPAGLLVNLAIWQEQPHWPSFTSGALVIPVSLWVHRRWVVPHSGQTVGDRERGFAQSE